MTLLSSLLFGTVFFSGGAQAAPTPKPDFKFNPEQYDLPLKEYNFPSGLRVIFQEDHTEPIVAVTVVIDRGSDSDPPGLEGIAHVCEHMVFKAKQGDLPKNWDVLQELGAMINATTSLDYTDFLTVAPKDSLETILRLEAMRLVDATAKVTADELSTELEVVRNELRMRYENAAVNAALEVIDEQLYPKGHPYSRNTIGTHETLSNIHIEDVRRFVQTNYKPENATMVVVGDVDPEREGEILQAAFSGLEDRLLVDPKNPKAPMVNKDPVPRVDCTKSEDPPPPVDLTTHHILGPVDTETAVVAWSLPRGYCSDEPAMEMAANLLPNYIYRTLVPSWQWSRRDQDIKGLGCNYLSYQLSSSIVCFIEPKSGYKGEKLVSKVADSLYLQFDRELLTNPNERPFVDYIDRSARASYMTGLFLSLDNVASLFGRAMELAVHDHFTGSPQYFADSINSFQTMDRTNAMAVAQKYLTRDRMVSVIVEPMDEEERARREASAKAANGDKKAWEGATADLAYSTVFDTKELTPEAVMNSTVIPEVATMKYVTLSNGMKVTLAPHGSAPLVRAGLVVRGSDDTADQYGVDTLAEALLARGAHQQEDIRAVAGAYAQSSSEVSTRLVVSGSSGNLDALLYTLRNSVADVDWDLPSKKSTIDGWSDSEKSAGEEPDTWSDRIGFARLLPGSPISHWWDADTFTKVRALTADQLKGWVASKYQPSNMELVIVGRMDTAKAEAAAKAWFESWTTGAEKPKPAASFPPPTSQPDRQILVFDKKVATQTQVDLRCQLTPMKQDDYAARQVLGDAVSSQAFRKLREEGGLTYGAYASTQSWPGGTSVFGLTSLVQNNGTGYAVKTMLDLTKNAATGGVDADDVARSRWRIGREYVYGETSGAQLWGRLATVREMGFDDSYFEAWRKSLANTTGDGFATMMKPCLGHEVITLVGPKDIIEAQLKEVSLPYEVVDWEQLHLATLTDKERKDYEKHKAQEAADKAKSDSSTGTSK